MEPAIKDTRFGSITIGGELYEHDVVIRLNGNIKRRKKKLSNAVYGTGHMVSLDEAEHIYDKGAKLLIIGTGQTGYVELCDEARDFFIRKGCKTKLLPTPKTINAWNDAKGAVIGMFHVTC
ncbi:MAG: Mth938-like domain-containing protein [Campylobacterota bacterium]|nr:Mth938-like domain-containing protein [Campylobacterota bacterium]